MARTAKPWFRAERDAWFVWHKGERVLLARGKAGKAAAYKAFHALMAEASKPARAAIDTGELVAQFLEHVRGQEAREEIEPVTREGYRRHLKPFAADLGHLSVAEIKPHHVQAWLDGHKGWNPTTRHGAITAVKRAFRWSRKLGLIEANPLEDLEKPRPRRREAIPDAEGAAKALAGAVSPQFRDFLRLLHETGCRPGEARALTAADLDMERGRWVRRGKTTGETGAQRVVYLTPAMAEVCRRLAAEHPEGPIFRNTKGAPWTQSALNTQVRRLRARTGLGKEMVPYALRHLFVTDALEGGVPIATVAELVGHKSTAMIARHYSHLAQRHDHLKDALGKVRGGHESPDGGGSGA